MYVCLRVCLAATRITHRARNVDLMRTVHSRYLCTRIERTHSRRELMRCALTVPHKCAARSGCVVSKGASRIATHARPACPEELTARAVRLVAVAVLCHCAPRLSLKPRCRSFLSRSRFYLLVAYAINVRICGTDEFHA